MASDRVRRVIARLLEATRLDSPASSWTERAIEKLNVRELHALVAAVLAADGEEPRDGG